MSNAADRGTPRHRLGAETGVGVVSGGAMILAAAAVLAVGSGEESALAPEPMVSLMSPRVVVLKDKRVLHLFDGDRLVQSYRIDLGTTPVGPKRCQGDGRTPLGVFRVVSKNANSRYHRFIGLSYPDLATVEWGLAHGLVSVGEASSIRRAWRTGRCPDWGTALGGGIGIHGDRIGRDWTGGCIALSDEHVEELFSVLRIGDPVEILP
ncbi:MAG: L,D-transpeptidase [Phycisphaerales bacterium]|nr:MAG: L,D-transpeptidase [Phycisphaerales bacterium]